jgi:Tfp pilus assembly protein PilO
LLLAIAGVALAYAALSEGFDRWTLVADLSRQLEAHRAQTTTPEDAAGRLTALTKQRDSLLTQLSREAGPLSGNPTGVLEFVNASAKAAGVRIESFVPSEAAGSEQIKQVAFKIKLMGGFHQSVVFINRMETCGMPVQILKLDISRVQGKEAHLEVTLEGEAYLVVGKTT